MSVKRLSKPNTFFCVLILLGLSAASITTPWASDASIEIPLPGGMVTKMIFHGSFFIDESPANQEMYRAFDPTYIQRLKSLCADCPALDVDPSQRAAFCQWAGKRLPTEEELKIAGVKDGKGFRCAVDQDRLHRAAPSKPIDEVFNPKKSFGTIKGGTCDPIE